MYKCSDNIKYGLDEGPAVGYYLGSSCNDQRFMTMYYKDMECETVGADSVGTSCSDTCMFYSPNTIASQLTLLVY